MCSAPQFGHVANVGAFTTSWVRRLACLVWLCLLLGCAILFGVFAEQNARLLHAGRRDKLFYNTLFYLIGFRIGTKVIMEEKFHLLIAFTRLVTVHDRNIDTYYLIGEPGQV